MKQHGFKKLLFALFLVWTSLCIITPEALALDETTLSGIPGQNSGSLTSNKAR